MPPGASSAGLATGEDAAECPSCGVTAFALSVMESVITRPTDSAGAEQNWVASERTLGGYPISWRTNLADGSARRDRERRSQVIEVARCWGLYGSPCLVIRWQAD